MRFRLRTVALALCGLVACNGSIEDPNCDCTANETCVDGACRPLCSRETDCTGAGMTCRNGICRLPECGNGIVEAGEACDGTCPIACTSGPACTEPVMLGTSQQCSVVCTLVAIQSCQSGDGCCPSGCDDDTDDDCPALESCGNGAIDPLETCDGDCPQSCDDTNTCTSDLLTGSPNNCTALCVHTPVESCSSASDGCCPAACDWTNDADCTCVGQSHADSRCDDGDLYWFDSCGVREELRQSCAGGACIDGACATSCAPDWQDTDIGTVSLPGSASCSGGAVTIVASGSDVWGTADEMHFVHQPLSGDGWIQARVVSNDAAAAWSKTGVMIRESLAANSTHAHVLVSRAATNPVKLDRRLTTGGTTSGLDGSQVSPPYWVRLTRRGNGFSGYESSDGEQWTWLGTHTVAMAADVLIGLTMHSHDNAVLATAVFDNVTVDVAAVPECFVGEDCGVGGSCDQGSCSAGPSAVSFVPATYQVNEDAGSVTVGVTRTGSGSGACTLTYSSNDGTASAGADYTASSGPLSWTDGELGEKTVTVPVLDRSGDQGSRIFTVVVTASSCSDTIGGDTATVTIRDTDGPPPSGAWATQGPSGCSDAYGSFDAFIPGMRGHGSCNRGGFVPETNVVIVSNLNSSGPGSLDAAIDAGCPKVILFAVSGVIDSNGSTYVANSCDHWSVVGASAPDNITVVGSTDALISTRGNYWTIDHVTLAAGDTFINPSPNLGLRDSIAFGAGQIQETGGILMNSNLIWGADETVQCYPPSGGERDDVLYWQNIIGYPVAGSGVHIIQSTCRYHNTIRTFYIHSWGRHPLVRSHGYFHANTFTANPGNQSVLIQACNGAASGGQEPTLYQNYINNFMVRGPNSNDQQYIRSRYETNCTDARLYEDGNVTMNDDNSIADCTNHQCLSQTDGSAFSLASSPITTAGAYPTGYVPQGFAANASELLGFATKITRYAGARPQSRLPLMDTAVSQAINMVDGTGDEGGWGAPTYPSNNNPRDTTEDLGGVAVLTPANVTNWDPRSGSDNPCAEDMPTGATADALQTSGLTRLHEWVIGCFYDNVMPSGYREDGLQNYPAP